MHYQGINANIMSLGGIAIAIGAMVDAAIIMIENAHKHLEHDQGKKDHWQIIADAAKEVGPTSVLCPAGDHRLVCSGLHAGGAGRPAVQTAGLHQDLFHGSGVNSGRHHRPGTDGLLDSREDPLRKAESHQPVPDLDLRSAAASRAALEVGRAAGRDSGRGRHVLFPYSQLGSEFMPPLWEGDLLYMPTTLPGISITKARELLQQTDKIIASFPEVHHVFGKIGRAETATDPAPLSMIETTIMLKPEDEWRPE